MIKYENVFREGLANKLNTLAVDVISGKYQEPIRTWTNQAWSDSIIGKDSAVFCMSIPEQFLEEIQQTLISRGILDTGTDQLLTESRSAMLYVWMPGA